MAITQAASRAAADTPGAHILDADAIRHLATIFEEPGEDEGIAITIISYKEC